MLLDCRESVDPVVVGVALVVGGHETRCLGVANLTQGDQADMSIEEHVLAGFSNDRGHRKRLDQAYFLDGRTNLFELPRRI